MSGGQFYPVARPRGKAEASGASQKALAETPSAKSAAQATTTPAVNFKRSELGDLTTREREILSLVAEGLQNKLIADRMRLSEHTVKVHVHNLMHKLNVSNRTQAAAAFHALPHTIERVASEAAR